MCIYLSKTSPTAERHWVSPRSLRKRFDYVITGSAGLFPNPPRPSPRAARLQKILNAKKTWSVWVVVVSTFVWHVMAPFLLRGSVPQAAEIRSAGPRLSARWADQAVPPMAPFSARAIRAHLEHN